MVAVLLYNLENDKGKKIESFCKSISIRAVHVDKNCYDKSLEKVLEEYITTETDNSVKVCGNTEGSDSLQTDENDLARETDFDDEMMVMCGFDRRLLDIFLREYKKRHIAPVSLKAVLTEQNRRWSSVMLYHELCRERAAIREGMKK